MERERGMTRQPAAKRARMTTVPVGDGDGARGEAEASSARSSKLWPTFFVVLFAVRMSETNPVAPSLWQIEATVQRIVDCAFNQFQEKIFSKVEKALQAFQGQIDNIHNEVRQMASMCSSRHADQHTRLEQNKEHAAATGSEANIRLRFMNDLNPPIYTEKNITDKSNAAIRVAMFEGGKIITSGPLSNVNVDVLVLRGEFCNDGRNDWTEEEFDNRIVQGRGEQGLLGTVRLTNGVAELSQIRFKKGTCRKNVTMAARVCKGENLSLRVQEAIMKPVVVLDRRNEANEKRYPPSLDDDVFRLEEIARNGPYRTRLREEGILSVQDFLKALNKDPNKLRKVILKMGNQNNSWSKLIRHARQCVLEDMPELKRFQSEDGNVVLFFNCVHDLIGAEFDRGYFASGNFSPDQKALVNKWKGRAYDELGDIPFDYIIKGNVPERISSSADGAAGPSVLVVNPSQPNFTTSQGIGAAENSPHGDINHIIPQNSLQANSDAIFSPHDYLIPNVYQAQETAMLAQQQPMIPEPIMLSQQDLDTFPIIMDGFPGEGVCFCLGSPLPWCPQHGLGPSCSTLPGSGPSNNCQ